MARYESHPWADFWRDLKAGYDVFEATRLPPRIGLCGQRYVVAPAEDGQLEDGPIERVKEDEAADLGFDPQQCRIDFYGRRQLDQVIASADIDQKSAIKQAEVSSTRAVLRLERREGAVAKGARAARPGRSALTGRKAERRARSKERRRAHRAELAETYRRNQAAINERRYTP